MEVYRRTYRVAFSDVDPQGRLRLSALFRLLQEAATDHAAALGVGSEVTLNRGILWVVTAQRARILQMPRYEETVTLLSWPGQAKHAFFPRYYRVLDAAGGLLAEASALWVLMDAGSRRMILPREGLIRVPNMATREEGALPAPPKMGEFTGSGAFTVPHSYLDLNGHMNNVRYFDLAEDFTPADLHARPVAEAVIKYGGEARLGEKIELRWGREEGAWFLAGDAEGRRAFRLRLEFGPAEEKATLF